MATYELMVILPGDMTQNEAEKHLETVKGYVKENGGEIKEELIWGKRDLAYAVKKNDVGFYAIYHFTLAGREGMHELKNELRLDQKVLRDLIIKVPDDYTFGEFETSRAAAEKAKEEAMSKRRKTGGPPKKKGDDSPTARAAERGGEIRSSATIDESKKEERPPAKSKKKSSSDTVLDDPDLKL